VGIEQLCNVCLAAKQPTTDLVELLLCTGRVDPTVDENLPLCNVALTNQLDMVKLLMSSPLVDPSMPQNHTIGVATARGHKAIFTELISSETKKFISTFLEPHNYNLTQNVVKVIFI
jgi:hypothetical protein